MTTTTKTPHWPTVPGSRGAFIATLTREAGPNGDPHPIDCYLTPGPGGPYIVLRHGPLPEHHRTVQAAGLRQRAEEQTDGHAYVIAWRAWTLLQYGEERLP